jgi:hypothetical protein
MNTFIRMMLIGRLYQLAKLSNKSSDWFLRLANRLIVQHAKATDPQDGPFAWFLRDTLAKAKGPATQDEIDAGLVAQFIRPAPEDDTSLEETPLHWYVVTLDGIIDWYLGHTIESEAYELASNKRLDGLILCWPTRLLETRQFERTLLVPQSAENKSN